MPLKTKSSVHSASSPSNITPIEIRCLTLKRDSRKYRRLMPFSQTRGRGNNMMHKVLKGLSSNTSRKTSSTEGHSGMSFQSSGLMRMISSIESSAEVSLFNRIKTRLLTAVDLAARTIITLDQAAFGTEFEVTLPRLKRCSKCKGSGVEFGSQSMICPECKGMGRIEHKVISGFGQVIISCTRCNGRGEVAKKPCKICGGNGLQENRARLKVKVPPGIDNGDNLVLRGQGEDGPYGGSPGDFYVTIEIKPHPYLTRRGMDLIYEANINFAQAALGAQIKIPTLTSERTIQVFPGTQSGTVLRLRGEGINHSQGRGDELVHINVRVPEKLSPRERELIEALLIEFEAEKR